MAEEENLFEDPEYKIFSRFDKIRDLSIRKASHIEQLERVRIHFLLLFIIRFNSFKEKTKSWTWILTHKFLINSYVKEA